MNFVCFLLVSVFENSLRNILGDGEIGYRGSKKTGIVARDLKSHKKEFLNRYTRRMWNLRVRYVIASKGRRVVK